MIPSPAPPLSHSTPFSLARALLALLVALLAGPTHAAAQGWRDVGEGLTVRVSLPWPDGLSRGYAPARLELRSERGDDVPVAAWGTLGRDARLIEVSVDGVVPAGGATVIELPLPLGTLEHMSPALLLSVDGGPPRHLGAYPLDRDADVRGVVVVGGAERAAGWPADRSQELSIGRIPDDPAFEPLAPRSAASTAWRLGYRLDELVHPEAAAPGRPGAPVGTYAVAQVPGAALPQRIESYTSLAALVVDGDAPPAGTELSTALRWMSAGGTVLIAGRDPERAARALLADDVLEARFELARIGSARVLRAGLGYLVLAPGPPLEGVDQRHALYWVLERAPRWVPHAPVAHSPFKPSTGIDTSPRVVPLLTILILSTLLIGPLNFAWARRRGRPVLILISTPVLAIATALILLAYGVTRDGLALRVATQSVAVLDQRTHELSAATARETFAGPFGSRAARPSAGTVIFPSIEAEDDDRGARYRVDFSRGGSFAGDFVGTRSLRQMRTVEQRTTRLRLALTPEGGGWRVANGLEADLSRLVFRAANGAPFALERLGGGAEALLEPTDEATVAKTLDALGLGSGHPLTASLAPGTYAALVDGPALVDDLALGGRELPGRHALLGVVDLAEAGGTR